LKDTVEFDGNTITDLYNTLEPDRLNWGFFAICIKLEFSIGPLTGWPCERSPPTIKGFEYNSLPSSIATNATATDMFREGSDTNNLTPLETLKQICDKGTDVLRNSRANLKDKLEQDASDTKNEADWFSSCKSLIDSRRMTEGKPALSKIIGWLKTDSRNSIPHLDRKKYLEPAWRSAKGTGIATVSLDEQMLVHMCVIVNFSSKDKNSDTSTSKCFTGEAEDISSITELFASEVRTSGAAGFAKKWNFVNELHGPVNPDAIIGRNEQ
jgi:hypothetical protein